MTPEEIDHLLVMSRLANKPLIFMVEISDMSEQVFFQYCALSGTTRVRTGCRLWGGQSGWSSEQIMCLLADGQIVNQISSHSLRYTVTFKGFVDDE